LGDREILRLTDIQRNFGVIQAIAHANFSLRAGEVMGLVGENGAGKSTMVKIIGGFDGGYTGSVELDGKKARLDPPARAEDHGIAIAQQELSLIPTLTVAENVFLGDKHRKTWMGPSALARRAKPHLEVVGLGDINPLMRADRLSVGEQHLVEIARLLSRDARILILDEPTAALGKAESDIVLDMIRRLRESDRSVILVSHRLDEIFEITDRVTVMRDGHSQDAVDTGDLTVDDLVTRMLGRELGNMFPEPRTVETDIGLRVVDLWPDGLVQPVSLEVKKGEIVGLAGQLGSGAGFLLASMAGSRPHRGGTVEIGGEKVTPTTVSQMKKLGLGYTSSDRKRDGLFLVRDVGENVTSPALGRISQLGRVVRKKARSISGAIADAFTVDLARMQDKVGQLSGGNQQKVAVGKWLSIEPTVLLIDEPTRGVDVGARAEIYDRLRELAEEGLSIVFASTDLAEVCNLPDRIVTFYRGEMIGIHEGDQSDTTRILADITQPDTGSTVAPDPTADRAAAARKATE
jgi:ribose transport system ATP-binding protein